MNHGQMCTLLAAVLIESHQRGIRNLPRKVVAVAGGGLHGAIDESESDLLSMSQVQTVFVALVQRRMEEYEAGCSAVLQTG